LVAKKEKPLGEGDKEQGQGCFAARALFGNKKKKKQVTGIKEKGKGKNLVANTKGHVRQPETLVPTIRANGGIDFGGQPRFKWGHPG